MEFYERLDGGVGPCHREFGKSWIPVRQRTGGPNDWFCFQKKSRMCKNDILDSLWPTRRHLKPDQSWRSDWKHYCAGIPLTPHHDVCQEDRAFAGTVRFEHLSHFGNCHEGRAFASTALVEHLPHSGNCHEGPASAGTALGEHLPPSGKCHESRAIAGNALGVHHPHSGKCHDHRGSGAGAGDAFPGARHYADLPGHLVIHPSKN